MSSLREQVEEYKRHILKPTDTFQFECKMCGKCCRKRPTPIVLTGLDTFRIAQTMGKPPGEILGKITEYVLGTDSHIPLLILKERLDGSCSLLRNGKCMVHSNKPIVCAIYPLGRMITYEQHKIQYFRQFGECPGFAGSTRTQTLQEWLDEFHIAEFDKEIMAWTKLVNGIAVVMHQIPKNKISDKMISSLLGALYFKYDQTGTYLEQAESNMVWLQEEFKKKYGLTIRYVF